MRREAKQAWHYLAKVADHSSRTGVAGQSAANLRLRKKRHVGQGVARHRDAAG
jgi:hypothetical protein